MKTAYVIENGVVTNVIVVDDDTDLSLFNAVIVPENQPIDIGYGYNNGVVTDLSGAVVPAIDMNTILAERANAEIQRRIKEEVNKIGIFEWQDMTPEKQQAWTEYRRALLDLPNQPGWPANIAWPVKAA
jgi:predicted amidohydrolase YtcJ